MEPNDRMVEFYDETEECGTRILWCCDITVQHCDVTVGKGMEQWDIWLVQKPL